MQLLGIEDLENDADEEALEPLPLELDSQAEDTFP